MAIILTIHTAKIYHIKLKCNKKVQKQTKKMQF